MRVDWRFPGKQAEEGFHRTWFNWGGLDGEVDVRPIGASDLSEPTILTKLGTSGETTRTPDDAAPRATATVKVGVVVHNYGPWRER